MSDQIFPLNVDPESPLKPKNNKKKKPTFKQWFNERKRMLGLVLGVCLVTVGAIVYPYLNLELGKGQIFQVEGNTFVEDISYDINSDTPREGDSVNIKWRLTDALCVVAVNTQGMTGTISLIGGTVPQQPKDFTIMRTDAESCINHDYSESFTFTSPGSYSFKIFLDLHNGGGSYSWEGGNIEVAGIREDIPNSNTTYVENITFTPGQTVQLGDFINSKMTFTDEVCKFKQQAESYNMETYYKNISDNTEIDGSRQGVSIENLTCPHIYSRSFKPTQAGEIYMEILIQTPYNTDPNKRWQVLWNNKDNPITIGEDIIQTNELNLDKEVIDISKGESVTMTINLPTEVEIYDVTIKQSAVIIKDIVANSSNNYIWDGKDSNGNWVNDGAYEIVLEWMTVYVPPTLPLEPRFIPHSVSKTITTIGRENIVEPETAEPETAEPETAEPETAEPETTNPGTTTPEATSTLTALSPTATVGTAAVFILTPATDGTCAIEFETGKASPPTVCKAGEEYSASHTYTTAGTYTLKGYLNGAVVAELPSYQVNAVVSTPSLTISPSPKSPEIDSSDDDVEVKFTLTVTNLVGPYDYKIEYGDGDKDFEDDQELSTATFTHKYDDDDDYTVKASVKTSTGEASSTYDLEVTVEDDEDDDDDDDDKETNCTNNKDDDGDGKKDYEDSDCKTPESQKIVISDARISRSPFNPSVNSSSILYKLNRDALVTIEIFDSSKKKVATILDGKLKPALTTTGIQANQAEYFYGKVNNDPKGQALPDGTYTYAITAANPKYATIKDTESNTVIIDSKDSFMATDWEQTGATSTSSGTTSGNTGTSGSTSAQTSSTRTALSTPTSQTSNLAALTMQNAPPGTTAGTGPEMLIYLLLPAVSAFALTRKK